MSHTSAPQPVLLTPERLSHLLAASDTCASQPRQAHGFAFESGVSNLLSLSAPGGYTAKWDAFDLTTAASDLVPYSFKNVRNGAHVELGSLARQAGVDRDFYFYVAFWSGHGRNMLRVHVMRVDQEYWRGLFPADVSPFLAEAAFSGISNSRADDLLWRLRRKELQAEWAAALPLNSPMRVHFKRDHKSQKRVQCSIAPSGFLDLFARCYDAGKSAELESALGPLAI